MTAIFISSIRKNKAFKKLRIMVTCGERGKGKGWKISFKLYVMIFITLSQAYVREFYINLICWFGMQETFYYFLL